MLATLFIATYILGIIIWNTYWYRKILRSDIPVNERRCEMEWYCIYSLTWPFAVPVLTVYLLLITLPAKLLFKD